VIIKVDIKKKRKKETEEYKLDELVGVKGWKAVGNRLTTYPVLKLHEVSSKEDDSEQVTPIEVQEESVSAPQEKHDKVVTTKAPPKTEQEDPQKESPAPAASQEKSESKQDADKSEKGEQGDEDGFHSGDTVEMKIDIEKIKKEKGQFGLFDE
jgi:hypothetical protein